MEIARSIITRRVGTDGWEPGVPSKTVQFCATGQWGGPIPARPRGSPSWEGEGSACLVPWGRAGAQALPRFCAAMCHGFRRIHVHIERAKTFSPKKGYWFCRSWGFAQITIRLLQNPKSWINGPETVPASGETPMHFSVTFCQGGCSPLSLIAH